MRYYWNFGAGILVCIFHPHLYIGLSAFQKAEDGRISIDLLVCETGSPSRLVNRLVEAGLIEQKQSEEDFRKVKLKLTEKGLNSVSAIIAIEEKCILPLAFCWRELPHRNISNCSGSKWRGSPAEKPWLAVKQKRILN